MNIGVHVPFSLMVSSRNMLSSEIARSYGSFIPSFFNEMSILFYIVAISVFIPTNSIREFPFLYNLSSIYYL